MLGNPSSRPPPAGSPAFGQAWTSTIPIPGLLCMSTTFRANRNLAEYYGKIAEKR